MIPEIRDDESTTTTSTYHRALSLPSTPKVERYLPNGSVMQHFGGQRENFFLRWRAWSRRTNTSRGQTTPHLAPSCRETISYPSHNNLTDLPVSFNKWSELALIILRRMLRALFELKMKTRWRRDPARRSFYSSRTAFAKLENWGDDSSMVEYYTGNIPFLIKFQLKLPWPAQARHWKWRCKVWLWYLAIASFVEWKYALFMATSR